MLRGNWRLISLCLALASDPVFGQENASGVPSEAPSVEENQPRQPNGGAGAPSYPPIRIVIEDTSEAASHAEERERSADEHEASDLSAQWTAAEGAQRAAASAERQEIPAWVQFTLAIMGTILAVIALVFSVLTARRAERTTRAQLRAYVAAESATIEWDKATPSMVVRFSNTGQTPSQTVFVSNGISVKRTNELPFGSLDDGGAYDAIGAIGANTSDAMHQVDQLDFRDKFDRFMRSNDAGAAFTVSGCVRYSTIFGEFFESEYMFFLEKNDLSGDTTLRRAPRILHTYMRVKSR